MRHRAAARLLCAIGLGLAIALVVEAARAAVIGSASVEQRNNVVEIHFGVRGRGLKWHLSTHRQQLWIDLDNTRFELPSIGGRTAPPVKRIDALNLGSGNARLVLEVSGKTDYVVARIPGELIVRVAPTGEAPDLAEPLLAEVERARNPARAGAPRARAKSQDALAVAAVPRIDAGDSAATAPSGGNAGPDHVQTAALTPPHAAPGAPPHPSASAPLVVIDPGHGGRDPGTEVAGAVVEKDVALAIARSLASRLAARGFETRLTRDDDTFLSLAERTAIANRARADLFISIHLNSSPDAGTAGIETYYLNNTTDRATMRLARMENEVAGGYSAQGQADLNYILSDLRQGYKANESASLARMIEAETAAEISGSLGLRVNALGAKKGPFYVLVGAEMPAVLVECGFLSNAGETQELTTPRYQQALADGIADAVVHYFNADAAVGNL
ncbi:MAG TPA: N-acetylmuramoyl-L-alanine amidase [Candidatus Binataceae bacterium]|nr:N-acetylmuramoyl-L-alanine amidase [Candidatus Binataceae bacterium]